MRQISKRESTLLKAFGLLILAAVLTVGTTIMLRWHRSVETRKTQLQEQITTAQFWVEQEARWRKGATTLAVDLKQALQEYNTMLQIAYAEGATGKTVSEALEGGTRAYQELESFFANPESVLTEDGMKLMENFLEI